MIFDKTSSIIPILASKVQGYDFDSFCALLKWHLKRNIGGSDYRAMVFHCQKYSVKYEIVVKHLSRKQIGRKRISFVDTVVKGLYLKEKNLLETAAMYYIYNNLEQNYAYHSQ